MSRSALQKYDKLTKYGSSPSPPPVEPNANAVPTHGNAKTMNLNNLVYQNVINSNYFKQLHEYTEFQDICDEIWNQVNHLEPWEKGTRRVTGQVGMCGGVRGVGAGGVVSSCFCLLYKLFQLRLTERQLTQLVEYYDSPYIRGIGLLYIRYCIPPAEMWDWLSPYIDDEEEVDPKSGGGASTTIGALARQMLVKLDWFDTLFPRIPVPVEKSIHEKMKEYEENKRREAMESRSPPRSREPIEKDPRGSYSSDLDKALEKRGYRTDEPPKTERDRGKREEQPRQDRDRERNRDRDRERERRRSRDRERDRDRRVVDDRRPRVDRDRREARKDDGRDARKEDRRDRDRERDRHGRKEKDDRTRRSRSRDKERRPRRSPTPPRLEASDLVDAEPEKPRQRPRPFI